MAGLITFLPMYFLYLSSLGLTTKDEGYETVNYKFMTFGYMNATEINETDHLLNFNNMKSI
ncbi:MAG: hypothetical protein HUJ59_01755, partial [Bacilli bacterium]|nr:hypothetical protein [Bacilli bacterium]